MKVDRNFTITLTDKELSDLLEIAAEAAFVWDKHRDSHKAVTAVMANRSRITSAFHIANAIIKEKAK